MTLYLVTDDWSNDGGLIPWGEDRRRGKDVIGVFNSKQNALEAVKALYFKHKERTTTYNYKENEWICDYKDDIYSIRHCVEIDEIKLNEILC